MPTSPRSFLARLDAAAQERARLGLRRTTTSPQARPRLDLAGNDYLGLLDHPLVVEEAVAAARRHGGGAGASRVVTGTSPVHRRLEDELAALTGTASALVLSTGYHANLAAVTALADRDTLIVSDAHVHASLVDGCRLARGQVVISRHNDPAHVRELLADRTLPHALVVVESVYSVYGDAAPLTELVEITAEYGAALLVDEAHGIGVVGDSGEGALAAAGLAGREHVVLTGTLSKSLAAQGGVIAAHEVVREHVVNTARPFVYDTGLAPAAAGAALGALRVLREEPGLPGRCRANAALLASALGSQAPAGGVLSAPTAGPQEAVDAVARAEERGLRIGCFRPPSTPDGGSWLRLTAHASHNAEEMEWAVGVLREIRS
ncbi:8-amino-7-oxononanoate synthase [Austwickia chelonae]|uniref:8-amino-7-oxononanoate synthase n=1 Tax=Austwickia chelonae NBRC 105200 TaxID=1184607 RepID=K6W7I2_9MICO|nr:aminotransferase class I/II-fold pyridoxal phosphate-dependent enzyme [Austwickia chelonae]GAB77787.1 8-amino-7-oxononanoate synthase [Austwickia chelonae NBRC 105200]SEV89501.1 8-amino-7-oxononanoate synthase [Austwickia chelonae]